MRGPKAFPVKSSVVGVSALAALVMAAPLVARERAHIPAHKVQTQTTMPANPFMWWLGAPTQQQVNTRANPRAQQREAAYQPLFPNLFTAWWRAPLAQQQAMRGGGYGELDGAIARHAMANGVPLELAQRVVKRESGGNPRAVSQGNYGLMQIRLGTARAMGYGGNAQGLLDADTNMTYAMKYLAGAYRAAGGNHDRAVALYASGYNHAAQIADSPPYQGRFVQTQPFRMFAWVQPAEEEPRRRMARRMQN